MRTVANVDADARSFTVVHVVLTVVVVACAVFAVSRVSVGGLGRAVDGELIVYGDAPSAFGSFHLAEGAQDAPVVVLVHGGFWRRRGGDAGLMEPLARDLALRGVAVWNIEYGRTGERFGGYPHTFSQVQEAIDYLAVLAGDHALDLERVSVVGHSAGGHLALWLGGRSAFPSRSAWDLAVPATEPVVAVRSVVGLAPIVDLRSAADSLLGNGAVVDLLGGTPTDVPLRYLVATPAVAGVPAFVVTGGADDDVPSAYSQMPSGSAAVESLHIDGATHVGLISPSGEAWASVLEWLTQQGSI